MENPDQAANGAKENPSVVLIDEVGPCQFVCFNESDIEVLRNSYRIICGVFSEKQSFSKFSSVVVLPEQVQVLVENGYASVRKIISIEGVEPSCSRKVSDEINSVSFEYDEKLLALARKAIVGRKIKELKRKAYGADATATTLKVKKTDNKMFAHLSDAVTDIEMKTVAAELCLTKLARQQKFDMVNKKNFSTPTKTSESAYQVIDEPIFPSSALYRRRLVTFRDLWRKGFYLTLGTKFGCDYLAYEKLPGKTHSKYMVICVDASGADASLKPLDLIAAARVGSQVKKQMLLSIVSKNSLIPYYIISSWWKGDKL